MTTSHGLYYVSLHTQYDIDLFLESCFKLHCSLESPLLQIDSN